MIRQCKNIFHYNAEYFVGVYPIRGKYIRICSSIYSADRPRPNLNGIAIYPTCLLYAFNPGYNLYEDYNPRSSSYRPLRIGLLGPARRIPAGGKRCFCSFSQVLSSMS